MKNKPLLVAMIMTMMVAGLFLTGGDVKKPKLSQVYDLLVEVYDLVSAHSVGAPVEKTGQTTYYEPGDDGDLEKGVVWPNPRFTDNEDGTVTDNLTGLIWLKNANCFDERFWSDALSDCNGLASGSCGLTDGSGAGDWRLPNIKELQSLIDYGFYLPALSDTAGTSRWSDDDPFTNVLSQAYWSSTTRASISAYAWYLWTLNGIISDSPKGEKYYVWPVRGGN
jgi:hypothetical protein